MKILCYFLSVLPLVEVSIGRQNEDTYGRFILQTPNDLRSLRTGEKELMKKRKTDSDRGKLTKNDPLYHGAMNMAKMKGKDMYSESGKGKEKTKGDEKGKTKDKGKGMNQKKFGKGKNKSKSTSPVAIETTTPSTTTVPTIFTSAPIVTPVLEPTTITASPAVLETEIPSITKVPTKVTETPVMAPIIPTEQPILLVPTDFEFIGSSNIVVRYELSSTNATVNMNQTIAATDLTCDYIRNELILLLGALESACIWFLPEFNGENETTMFPVDIAYASTAAFPSNMANITVEILDETIVEILTAPDVDNLIQIFNTQLTGENPFSLTVNINVEDTN